MKTIHLYQNDKILGPYSEDELQDFLQTEKLTEETQVSLNGGEWQPFFGAFPELRQGDNNASTTEETVRDSLTSSTYHIANNGTVLGPYTYEQIDQFCQQNFITEDYQISIDSGEWQPVNTLFYIKPASAGGGANLKPRKLETTSQYHKPPYLDDNIRNDKIVGIGRLTYFVIFVSCIILRELLTIHLDLSSPNGLLTFASIAIVVLAAVQRSRNIGRQWWYGLLLFIPLLNFIIHIRCMIEPPRFAIHRKYDWVAKTIFVLCLLVIVGLVALFFLKPSFIKMVSPKPTAGSYLQSF